MRSALLAVAFLCAAGLVVAPCPDALDTKTDGQDFDYWGGCKGDLRTEAINPTLASCARPITGEQYEWLGSKQEDQRNPGRTGTPSGPALLGFFENKGPALGWGALDQDTADQETVQSVRHSANYYRQWAPRAGTDNCVNLKYVMCAAYGYLPNQGSQPGNGDLLVVSPPARVLRTGTVTKMEFCLISKICQNGDAFENLAVTAQSTRGVLTTGNFRCLVQGAFQIFAKGTRTLTLTAVKGAAETIASIRGQIRAKNNNQDPGQITYGGKPLKYDLTLGDYNIGKEATLSFSVSAGFKSVRSKLAHMIRLAAEIEEAIE